MFGSRVTLTIDEKGIVHIKSVFGLGFEKYIVNNALSPKRTKALFIDVSIFEISFYEFFALEVYHILTAALDRRNVGLMLNSVNINLAIEEIKERTWIGDMDKSFNYLYDDKIIKEKFVYDILDKQRPWFEEYSDVKQKAHYRGYLLEGEPGSGKTFMALALSELEQSDITIAISPNNAVYEVWVNSLSGEKKLYKEPQENIVISRDTKYNDETKIICPYTMLEQLRKLAHFFKNKKVTVIVDEIHKMNEKEALRTNHLINFVNEIKPENVLLLSGTPIKAKPSEMLTMIALIDYRFNKDVKRRYDILYKGLPPILKPAIQERYGGYRVKVTQPQKDKKISSFNYKVKLKNGKDYTLSAVKVKIKEYVEQRTKYIEDNMDTYIETYRKLYNSAKEEAMRNGVDEKEFEDYEYQVDYVRRMYAQGRLMEAGGVIKRTNAFEKNVINGFLNSEDKKVFREVKSIYKYPALKIRGEVLGVVVTRERIRCHADMAAAIKYQNVVDSTLKKTIIFTGYIDVAQKAVDTLRSQGYNPIYVYGDSTKDLDANVTTFNNKDNDRNPMVTTYSSLSSSVPMVVANTILFLDMPFRSYIYEQAKHRIDRLDQDSPMSLFHAVLDTGNEPNLNSRNIDIIKWSAEMVSEITGNNVDLEVGKGATIEDETSVSMESYMPGDYVNLIKPRQRCICFEW